MNNIFAEFFSPLVSRLHLSDPTINSHIFDYPSDVKSQLPKFDENGFPLKPVSVVYMFTKSGGNGR